jgi:CO/xanthine dehydrogenase FAD-binding subunit
VRGGFIDGAEEVRELMDGEEREHADLVLLFEQPSQEIRANQDRQILIGTLTQLASALWGKAMRG